MFFAELSQLIGEGDTFNLTLSKKGERLIVSVLPKCSNLKDEAKNKITPLVVSGLPDELDNGFINTVSAPIQKATGILSNIRAFERSASEAEANSKAAKAEGEKKKKEADANRKKYEEFTKKADEAEKSGKLREAIAALKEADHYATGNHSAISGRIQRMQSKLNANSIFGEEELLPEEAEAGYNENNGEE